MILVVGATGLLGIEACRQLAARGEKVRALVRPTSAPDKIAALQACGAELFQAYLKDPASLQQACRGVDAIISTAASTFSRQPGDSIASVDSAGQLSLVSAAKAAGIDRLIFVSFRRPADVSVPLADAKARVEESISDMNFALDLTSVDAYATQVLGR